MTRKSDHARKFYRQIGPALDRQDLRSVDRLIRRSRSGFKARAEGDQEKATRSTPQERGRKLST